jgi:two-component system, cell cycle response regulator
MKILIAEDDPVSCRLLEVTLQRWGYEVLVARDGVEAWECLKQEDAPHLAVLDWMMPGMDGLEICRELRRQRREPYTYILLLTARGGKQDIIEGLAAGADDYVVKPFNVQELQVRLRAGVRIVELQADLIAAREELRHQATHDPLTGLWNRGAILEILRRELARSRRSQAAVGLVLTDLDHFKRINDLFGHAAGDAVLREAARRFEASVRVYDSVGRYGGEEFLIVLPGCDVPGLLHSAERLRAALASSPVETLGARLELTGSFGIVTTGQLAGKVDPDVLIRAADTALYRAKNGGRNRAELTTPAEMAPMLAELELGSPTWTS